MQTQNINVLYVDDEANNLIGFKANFRRYYNIFTAISAKEAEEVLATNEIHVLITDQKMPETRGTELLESAIVKYPDQARILLSAYADSVTVIDAFQKGLLVKFVLKPYNPDELKKIIDTSYEVYTLNKTKNSLYKEWMKTQEEMALLKKSNNE
jgi:response regulator RpfG family c-di-GMP phosphodiesterase